MDSSNTSNLEATLINKNPNSEPYDNTSSINSLDNSQKSYPLNANYLRQTAAMDPINEEPIEFKNLPLDTSQIEQIKDKTEEKMNIIEVGIIKTDLNASNEDHNSNFKMFDHKFEVSEPFYEPIPINIQKKEDFVNLKQFDKEINEESNLKKEEKINNNDKNLEKLQDDSNEESEPFYEPIKPSNIPKKTLFNQQKQINEDIVLNERENNKNTLKFKHAESEEEVKEPIQENISQIQDFNNNKQINEDSVKNSKNTIKYKEAKSEEEVYDPKIKATLINQNPNLDSSQISSSINSLDFSRSNPIVVNKISQKPISENNDDPNIDRKKAYLSKLQLATSQLGEEIVENQKENENSALVNKSHNNPVSSEINEKFGNKNGSITKENYKNKPLVESILDYEPINPEKNNIENEETKEDSNHHETLMDSSNASNLKATLINQNPNPVSFDKTSSINSLDHSQESYPFKTNNLKKTPEMDPINEEPNDFKNLPFDISQIEQIKQTKEKTNIIEAGIIKKGVNVSNEDLNSNSKFFDEESEPFYVSEEKKNSKPDNTSCIRRVYENIRNYIRSFWPKILNLF